MGCFHRGFQQLASLLPVVQTGSLFHLWYLMQIDFIDFTLAILLLGKNDRKSFFESMMSRSSHPEVFLVKGVLQICSKSAGEHPRQNVISIKLLCNFIEIALLFECSSVIRCQKTINSK